MVKKITKAVIAIAIITHALDANAYSYHKSYSKKNSSNKDVRFFSALPTFDVFVANSYITGYVAKNEVIKYKGNLMSKTDFTYNAKGICFDASYPIVVYKNMLSLGFGLGYRIYASDDVIANAFPFYGVLKFGAESTRDCDNDFSASLGFGVMKYIVAAEGSGRFSNVFIAPQIGYRVGIGCIKIGMQYSNTQTKYLVNDYSANPNSTSKQYIKNKLQYMFGYTFII